MSILEVNRPTRAQEIDYPELDATQPAGQAVIGQNTALLDSVKVKLSVFVGHAETTLGELMNLKESAVLKIDRMVEQPVDIMINGEVVARGQLIAVDDNFGVQITEVASVRG